MNAAKKCDRTLSLRAVDGGRSSPKSSSRKRGSDKGDASNDFEKMVSEVGARLDKRKQNRRKTIGASAFDRTTKETAEMTRSGDWEEATPRHLVALFALMHQRVYGIECTELDAKARYTFGLRAGNFVKQDFGGNIEEAVEFFRWVWSREKGREQWRRENQVDGTRIGPGLMFSKKLITDYRLSLARKAHKG